MPSSTAFSLFDLALRVLKGQKCMISFIKSCALGTVVGVGFKLIAPVFSSQSTFEVSTKFAFSLPFSVLPSIVYMQFPIILLQFKKCFSHSNVFFFICPISHTLTRASISVQVPLVRSY